MPNHANDAVFALIKSLTMSEKRYFSLYISRHTNSEDTHYMQLFESMSRMKSYNEKKLLSKASLIKPLQLSNLKAHLYHEILTALQLFHSSKNLDIQIREQINFARILYNRGLVNQSLKVLDRVKSVAKTHSHFILSLEILQLENVIESRHITRSIRGRAEQLHQETKFVLAQVAEVAGLSSLALRLYGIYLENGHRKNEAEAKELTRFFKQAIQGLSYQQISFFGKGYLHQAYCWYYYIQLDFVRYYLHASKWVRLFEENAKAKAEDPFLYLKGLHNLVNALFLIGKEQELKQKIESLNSFYQRSGSYNENLQIQAGIYLSTAQLNYHFLTGEFTKGLALVPLIEQRLSHYRQYIDKHRELVFYYKIGCLYFGAGYKEKAIQFLNKIIQLRVGHLRSDLQCFARLLHLLAHYELGNVALVEYLIKSVYRFFAKMEHLDPVQTTIFEFLKRTLSAQQKDTRQSFIELKQRLEEVAQDKYARRSYQYLDIISWLESKIERIPLEKIIQSKKERAGAGQG